MTLAYEDIRAWAVEQATTWARDENGNDRLRMDGLEPAWALRVEAFNLLLAVGADAAGLRSDLGTPGLFGALKRRGLDRAARAWVLRTQALASRNRPPRGPSVLFLAEFPTPSMLEPMLRVARALPRDSWLAAAVDPRTFRAFREVGPRLALVLSWREEAGLLRDHRRLAAAAWRRLRAQPPDIRIAGRDITPAALDALEPLVLRSLPWLAVERAAIERVVDRYRPGWLVVASDQHRLGRTAVDIARSAGARSMVLQHGLPQYDLGYVPVVADVVATWSAADDAWFTTRGTPPERLVRLGNPRLDDLAGADRRAVGEAAAGRLDLAGKPRLLVALSPNAQERNAAVLDAALEFLALEPTAVLVVKLHPGDGRWADVRAAVRATGPVAARVRVVRRDALQPLLAWADAVLLHRSTVAVEALAAGTPVIVAAGGPPSPDDALPLELDLPGVATAGELRDALRAVSGTPAREAFIAARRVALEHSTGALDGRAADRIAAYLGGDA